jgi:hypothetical protein
MFEAFAGIAVGGENNGSLGQAKQKLLEEEGDTGQQYREVVAQGGEAESKRSDRSDW